MSNYNNSEPLLKNSEFNHIIVSPELLIFSLYFSLSPSSKLWILCFVSFSVISNIALTICFLITYVTYFSFYKFSYFLSFFENFILSSLSSVSIAFSWWLISAPEKPKKWVWLKISVTSLLSYSSPNSSALISLVASISV